MKKTTIFLTMIFLITLSIAHTAVGADSPAAIFNKEALLEKIKEASLLNDIRWVENKGQLTSCQVTKSPSHQRVNVGRGTKDVGADPCVRPNQMDTAEFYDSIKYYAKTPWGYFLIKDDNEIILNFVKPVKYQKGNIIVLKEQPDWEEYAKEELDLPQSKIDKLKEIGFVKTNGREMWLETAYKDVGCGTRDDGRKKGAVPFSPFSFSHQSPISNPQLLLSNFNLSYRSYNLYITLNGKNPVKIEAKGEREEKQSYFKGNDPSKWVSSLNTYNEIWAYFENGIIFRFYPKGNQIEKEIIIPEGVSLEDINLTYASERNFTLSTEPVEVDEFDLIVGADPCVCPSESYQTPEKKSPSVPLYERGKIPLFEKEGMGEISNVGNRPACSVSGNVDADRCIRPNQLTIQFDGYEFTEEVPFAYVIDENGNTKAIEAEYIIGSPSHQVTESPVGVKGKKGPGPFLKENVKCEDLTPKEHLPFTIHHPLFTNSVQISSAWDGEGTFVFDPLLASTYLGGNSSDFGESIVLDTSNNVYVAGFTASTDYPTTGGAWDQTPNSPGYAYDIVVSKLNSDLTTLSASTYLGGSSYDHGISIALDASNNVYVAGYTASTNYPVTAGVYGISCNGGYDIFISKLTSDLTTLSASTYLGGSSHDYGTSIALDTSNNVYVAGFAESTDYPTTGGAWDQTPNSPGYAYDIVVSKLTSDLTTLSASTYLGGNSFEPYATGVVAMALDGEGNVYITAESYSTDYSTTEGAYMRDLQNAYGYSDIVVSKLNATLTTLVASTYLGGDLNDQGLDIVIDSANNVYVVGCSMSTNYPTTSGAYDRTQNGYGYYDIVVSKLPSDLTAVSASTYLGGTLHDLGISIALDSSNNVYIGGHSCAANYPVISGASYDESFAGNWDLIVSKLPSDLTTVSASTYLGGTGDDRENSIVLDASNNVYVAGYTTGTDYPTTDGAWDQTQNSPGYYDVVISKLSPDLSCMVYTGGSGDGDAMVEYSTDTEVGFGEKNKLIFTTSPSDSVAGEVFLTQPVVTIQDEYGNTVTSATDAVTISINNNPNNGTLSGTATIAAVLGIATYPGAVALSINEPGYGYTLQAASGDLTTASSSAFNVGGSPWVSYISGSQLTDGTGKVRISYTANDIESNACNVTATPSLAQYSLDNSLWSNATLSGTTASITATPTGTDHIDLYWGGGTDSNNTEDLEVYFKLKLNDGTYTSPSYEVTAAFILDTKVPVISSATGFVTSPMAGSTSIQLISQWTDSNSSGAVSTFYYDLNGAGYSGGIAGSTGTLSPVATISVGGTLNGQSYFNAIKSTLADSYGNTSAVSETTTDVGVKPYTPGAPTVQNATSESLDIIVNKNSNEVDNLYYCIYITPAVGGGNYVQAGGSIGASAVWQPISSWSTVTVSGLSIGMTYSFKTKSRNYYISSVESDFSSAGGFSTSPISSKEYNLEATYKYISSTRLEFLVWLEQGGQVITSELSGTATVNIYEGDGSPVTITGKTDSSPDNQGIYTMNTVRSSGAYIASTSYYATVQLPYQGTTYTQNLTIDISSISASLTSMETKIDTVSTIASSILEYTGTTLPATLSSLGTNIDTISSNVDEILIDTGTTLSGNITTAKQDIIAELDKGPKAKILNRETTVESDDTVTIRYKTDTGLSPKIDVYDANNTKRVDAASMSEIGGTGVYEYDLTLTSGWGTGDYTVICSEASKNSIDSISLTVTGISALSSIESKIDSIDSDLESLTSKITSIQSTVEDTNTDLTSMQTDINNIISKWGTYTAEDLQSDTGNLETYIGTPEDTVDDKTIFGKIAEVNEATGLSDATSTYAQNAYEEIQSLRNEINFNGKTDTAYNMLNTLKTTMAELQTSITEIPTQVNAAGTEEIYNTINASLAELKQIVGNQGYEGALQEIGVAAGQGGIGGLTNQLSELKALLEVTKTLMQQTTEEPVVQTWFEME
ncbi:MAG: SBBP repeat-containing protein [Candidatus Omnitrophota bacterium]